MPKNEPTLNQQLLTEAWVQARAQPWVDIEVHQMDAGTYRGACRTLSTGRMHLVHEQQNRQVHKVGVLPENACTISFFLSQDPAMRFSHFNTPEPHTFLLPEQTDFDILVPGHVDTLYLCLEQDRLMACARIINESFWESPPGELCAYTTPNTGQLAADFLNLLSIGTHGASAALSDQLESQLIDSILLTLNNACDTLSSSTLDLSTRQRANRRVKLAREFIDASLQAGHLPSMVEICAHAGVSERGLQYAFRDQLQLSPLAYLRLHRLNRVRRDLLDPATAHLTVTQIAMNWGFLHLSKFARDYRQLFGEPPSETLARGKLDL